MSFSVEKDIKTLLSISKQTYITEEHSKLVVEIINRYFNSYGRNQSFKEVEAHISKKFGEILSYFDLDNGTKFATNYYQFCYTLLQGDKGFTGVQNGIYSNVAVPFMEWVKVKGKNIKPLLSTIPEGEVYVFICRRAMVNGTYAPGKSIYTYAEALLSRGENVWIIVLWNSDQEFMNLKKKYPKLKISVLFKSSLEVNLISVIEILKLAEPKVILTEIQFDLSSIIAILNSKIPTIYLSPGFYNLPWYDAIGLSLKLDKFHEGRSKKAFFDIPTWVNQGILAPTVDNKLIDQAKKKLGINEIDFVIGAFARMEYFQEQFLDFICRVLDRDKRIKVLLAGPNDNTNVIIKLNRFINEGRAIVLGSVDVNIIGHCLDLGLDTFPMHGGYSVLELMAKDIPVITKKDEEVVSYIPQRLPDTIRAEEAEMESLIIELLNNTGLLEIYRQKTNEFMSSQDQSKTFLKALDNRINILKL